MVYVTHGSAWLKGVEPWQVSVRSHRGQTADSAKNLEVPYDGSGPRATSKMQIGVERNPFISLDHTYSRSK